MHKFSFSSLFSGSLSVALLSIALLAGCAPDPARYAGQTPALRPDQFFDGTLDAYGVFEDWRGQATSRFHMVATAAWHGTGDNKTGSMHEDFSYADGSKATRDWTFRMVDASTFIGTAPDVVGEARGTVYGNALHWVYTIYVPTQKPREEQTAVTFDDWLYLVGDGADSSHMISRVAASKFGVPVGQLTMFFEKRGG